MVKNSMVELNKIILDSALKNRINPYCLPPTDFMSGNKPIKNKILTINEIAKSGLTQLHMEMHCGLDKKNPTFCQATS